MSFYVKWEWHDEGRQEPAWYACERHADQQSAQAQADYLLGIGGQQLTLSIVETPENQPTGRWHRVVPTSGPAYYEHKP